MKPFTYSVFDLFERTRRHLVPLFQRPYVWTRERQWSPLWNDIVLLADDNTASRDVQRDHFLGAAVISRVKTYGKQIDAMDIIDGQQRLTTLQILLLALRDFIGAVNYDARLHTTLRRLTLNNDRMEQDFERFKVWPTNSDRDAFVKVATAESREEVESRLPAVKGSKGRHPFADAYLYFYDAIGRYVRMDDGTVSLEHLEALQETIVRRLKLVVIELEEGDNPQIIFETLNARGEPLRASDLIRNFIFLDADRRGEDIEKLYNTYWLPFDQPLDSPDAFWKQEERQGRLTRARLDLLIFYYLTMKMQREIPITGLFQEFSAWWRAQRDRSVEAGLTDLQRYALLFQSLYTGESRSRLAIFAERLRILDTGTVYPLLLYLVGERTDIAPEELNGILTDIESYLVRRNLCGHTSQNYNQFFRSMLVELSARGSDGQPQPITRDRVRSILLSSSKQTSHWPSDEEFAHAWLTRPMYEISSKRAGMVLTALNLHMMTHKQEQVQITAPLSIEHVYPRNPDPAAWKPLPPDSAHLIHTFGNLTLVTASFNSVLGNRSFVEKRKAIAAESLLRLNVYFQSVIPRWDAEAIELRGQWLFGIARQVWPRP